MTPFRTEYTTAGLAGLLVPQANTTVEAEMSALLPPGCGAITARLTSSFADSRDRLLHYFERVEAALDTFDSAQPGVALFACTGSSYLVGRDAERAQFAAIEGARGFPVVSAAQAVGDALAALGAQRIAIVSPYPTWLTVACAAFWRAQGCEIVAVADMAGSESDTRTVYSLGSKDALAALSRLDTSGAQAILLTGTGMPTLGAIAAAGGSLPVLSSNLCLAWKAAQILGSGNADLGAWLGAGAWWRGALAARFPDTMIR
jgi:maleate isomerase